MNVSATRRDRVIPTIGYEELKQISFNIANLYRDRISGGDVGSHGQYDRYKS